jgi:hypothetical protein
VVPLPPVTPNYETSGHREDDGVEYDREDENYPGGGPHNHQPTQCWTDDFDQEAGPSTGLAAAQPQNRENETQSEVSIFLPR